jgi:hypothetical protein
MAPTYPRVKIHGRCRGRAQERSWRAFQSTSVSRTPAPVCKGTSSLIAFSRYLGRHQLTAPTPLLEDRYLFDSSGRLRIRQAACHLMREADYHVHNPHVNPCTTEPHNHSRRHLDLFCPLGTQTICNTSRIILRELILIFSRPLWASCTCNTEATQRGGLE